MSPFLFTAYILAAILAFWLGTFLLGRDPGRPALRNAGLGLLFYALALAGLLLGEMAPSSILAQGFARLANPLLFLPAILWAGTLAHLLPENAPYRQTFIYGWRYALPALLIGFLALGLGTDWIFSQEGEMGGAGYLVAAVVALLPLLEALLLIGVGFWRAAPRRPRGVLGVALLFFSLSTTLLVVSATGLPRALLLVGMGVDLLLLGLAVAALDAFDEGEAWLPELLRSLLGTLAALLLFAAPAALTMRLATGLTLPMTALLLTLSAAAIASQTFRPWLQSWLDDLAYAPWRRLQQAQADLRRTAQVQARHGDTLDPAQMEAAAFARLTRRALSHFGNLPKLAASPLTGLVLVDQRLQAEQRSGDTLERAAVLKQILAESIERLRPLDGDSGFHSSEEWRHFNALYYPYVAGLRPYSRRASHDDLPADAQAALAWFRSQIPERTLYNWQAAAAELVAQDLRERCAGH
jgi:hypothetical protein